MFPLCYAIIAQTVVVPPHYSRSGRYRHLEPEYVRFPVGAYHGCYDCALPCDNRNRQIGVDAGGALMARATGSWLSGAQVGGNPNNEYQGQDLGLPERGPGSLATGWTRCWGLLVDWLMAYGITLLFVRGDTMAETIARAGTPQIAIWFVVGVFTITFFGFTPGQFVAGMRVIRVDHGPEFTASIASGEKNAAVGFVRALMRQVLIVFIVPALMNDYNGRALHDRATGTAVVRTR